MLPKKTPDSRTAVPVTKDGKNVDQKDGRKDTQKVAEKVAEPHIVPINGAASVRAMPIAEYYDTITRPHRFVPAHAWRLIGRRLYVEVFYRGLMDRGAILSFYTLLTAIPTLLAFYSIASLVLAQNRDKVRGITEDFINQNVPGMYAEEARKIIDSILGSTQQSMITLVISVAIALFSSSAYVRAFSRSANALYGRQEGRSLIRTWLVMWGLTIALVVGLVIIAAAFFLQADFLTPVLNAISQPLHWEGFTSFVLDSLLPVWAYLRWPVIFGLSIVLIAVLFTIAPNVKYGRMRWLTTGSAFALVGITIVGLVVRTYVNNFLHIGMYGALGGLIGGFFGLVISNTILLLGLKLDAEMTRSRELAAGLTSEDIIQVPPRSSVGADVNNEIDDQLREKARAFRRGYSAEPAGDSGDSLGPSSDTSTS